MKEQLVIQLKTQIVDLERFIDFLQGKVIYTCIFKAYMETDRSRGNLQVTVKRGMRLKV